MLLILILAALGTFPLTTSLLAWTQPFFLLGARMTIAGIFLALYHYFFAQRRSLKRAHLGLYIQIILCAIFIPYCLRYYGLLHTPAPRALLLYNLGPIMTYIFACWCGTERYAARMVGILIFGLSGLLLLFGAPLVTYSSQPFGYGDCALLLAVASLSYGWMVMRTLIVQLDYAPVTVNALAMLGGGLLGCGAAYSFESQPYVTNMGQFIVLLTAIIILSNFVAHNLYATLLKTYSLTLLQLGCWLTPVMAGIGRMVWHQELVTSTWLCGAVMIMMSFVVAYRGEMRAAQTTTAQAT